MDIDLHRARELANIQRRLLTLDPDPHSVGGIIEDAAQLMDADAAMAAWLKEGTPWLVTWNAGPQIEEYFFRTFAGVDRDGNIRSTDPDLDRINLTRRQMGSGVYHESALASRAMIENAAFHQEAFRPAGMRHVIGMTKRLAVGEAVFAMGYRRGDAPALAEGSAEIVLNLLLPAFASAFATLDQQERTLERLQRAISESDMEVSVEKNGDWDRGGAFLNLPLPGPDKEYLAISPPNTAALASRLAENYGLSKRQEDVAHCLLDGLPTKDTATRLGISPNTVRRHCEAVLNRTGASRRGELNRIARSVFSDTPEK